MRVNEPGGEETLVTDLTYAGKGCTSEAFELQWRGCYSCSNNFPPGRKSYMNNKKLQVAAPLVSRVTIALRLLHELFFFFSLG